MKNLGSGVDETGDRSPDIPFACPKESERRH